MTWKELKDLFYEAVSDSESAHSFFSAGQVQRFAAKALTEIAERTHCLESYYDFNTQVGYAKYGLPGTILRVWRVELDAEAITPRTTDEIRKVDRGWRERVGEPRYYYLDGMRTSGSTYNMGLWEEPGSIYAVRAYYYGEPAEPDDDNETDEIQLPEWATHAVLLSMLADAYMTDTFHMNLNASSMYRRMFNDVVNRIRVRSFGKINKSWSYETGSRGRGNILASRLPEHIPEP